MSRLIRLLLLISLVAGLTACGQKGPLRRPEAGTLAVGNVTTESTIR